MTGESGKVSDIVQSSGCEPKLASLLLEFTGGDPEGVKKILEAVEKDILIFKVRFSATTVKKYGMLLVFLNRKKKSLEKFIYLVSGNEEGSMFMLKKNWEALADDITNYRADNREEDETPDVKKLTDKIGSQMTKKLIQTDTTYVINLYKRQNPKLIDKYFANEIYNYSGDPAVKIEVIVEEVDVFALYKSSHMHDDALPGEMAQAPHRPPEPPPEVQPAEKPEEASRDASEAESELDSPMMSFNTELVLAPVNGKAVSELEVGDQVFLRVVESTSSAKYLSDLLNLKKEDGEYRLKAPVAEINEAGTGNAHIITELGPNIIGKAVATMNTKVAVDRGEAEPSSEKKKGGSSNAFFYGILALVILVIALMLLIRFSN